MEATIENETHKVVYIEYSGNMPHSVITAVYVPNATNGPYWCRYEHDFFLNGGDLDDLRHYCAGFGGNVKELQAPKFIDGYIGQFWIDERFASFRDHPKNFQQLKYPKLIKSAFYGNKRNPFLVAEETNSYEHCEVCGLSFTDICDQHQYISELGELHYKHRHGHGAGY